MYERKYLCRENVKRASHINNFAVKIIFLYALRVVVA